MKIFGGVGLVVVFVAAAIGLIILAGGKTENVIKVPESKVIVEPKEVEKFGMSGDKKFWLKEELREVGHKREFEGKNVEF